MAEVCMENYDPEFTKLTKPVDVLVTDFNLGCGSSRGQAATAILARDIPLVVAGSLGASLVATALTTHWPLSKSLAWPSAYASRSKTTRSSLSLAPCWKLLWDVRRSKAVITEKDGTIWEEKLSGLPPVCKRLRYQRQKSGELGQVQDSGLND
ncbi:hypothetical protein B0T10DRAFT_607497 [Thelonectria olida]|uniref:Aconitase A/isopropylmalate dehydratase small subunit swivel domain-containing protein n=1 Tax=Thelonectria olida TaxID=1576542 RepID=A0A9P9ANU5_9HYPO|nr:hypothetical protein B0T10DRAFT_607497 [Thelonectria olida]